jgi:hypothetical protein
MIPNRQLVTMAIHNSELPVEWIDGTPYLNGEIFEPAYNSAHSEILKSRLDIHIEACEAGITGRRSHAGILVGCVLTPLWLDNFDAEQAERSTIIEVAAMKGAHDYAREQARVDQYLAMQKA